ncbi:hypothetical protein BN2127_JRS1_03614 [Bacillus cereus]|nr:hypothetical protein BN2127_JRS1_03614 [Bacillus cereus]
MEVTITNHSEVPCASFIMSDWEPNLLSTKKIPKLLTYLIVIYLSFLYFFEED